MSVKARVLTTTDDKGDRRRGEYDVRLRTPDGHHVRKTFRKQSDALRWERDARVAMDRVDGSTRAASNALTHGQTHGLPRTRRKRPTAYARTSRSFGAISTPYSA